MRPVTASALDVACGTAGCRSCDSPSSEPAHLVSRIRDVDANPVDAPSGATGLGMTCEEGRGGRRLIEVVQLRADLIGSGRVECVKDVPSDLPGFAGGVGIVGAAVDGSKMGEGAGFAVAISELPEQRKRFLITGDGLGMVAAVVVDVTET